MLEAIIGKLIKIDISTKEAKQEEEYGNSGIAFIFVKFDFSIIYVNLNLI